MKKILIVILIIAGCSSTKNDDNSLKEEELIKNGYKRWQSFNIYFKKKDELTIFFTLEEKSDQVVKKHFYLEIDQQDTSNFRRNYILLSPEDSPDTSYYAYSNASDMLYKLDTIGGFIALTQIKKSFTLKEMP
ncbi:MAG: hypothetical protein R8G66_14260 [Cytophagales bacterium]|nr:hypothetical protein [Cytophagales bacterium]